MGKAFKQNYRGAALRHFEAATSLLKTSRKDVAGYLFGISGECGLKELMRKAGMRPRGIRHGDPFFAHFGEIKALIRDTAQGRLSTRVFEYVTKPKFMEYWDVDMRYSDGKGVKDAWITSWQADAKKLIHDMDL